jgi:hypothetical protein
MTLLMALTTDGEVATVEAIRRFDAPQIALLEPIEQQLGTAPRVAARLLVRIIGAAADDALPAIELDPQVPPARARELVVLRGAQGAFGGWARKYGFAVGVLGATVSALRDLDSRFTPLPAPDGVSTLVQQVDPGVFTGALAAELQAADGPLDRVRQALGIDDTALAGLFGVSRQAVAQWRGHDIPMARRGALLDMVATVDLLERMLKPGMLPLLAVKPVARLGGRTLLQALAEDPAGTRQVYESAFDYATPA